jgi:hypothetical protein
MVQFVTIPSKILICLKSRQQSRYVHKKFANYRYLVGLVKRVRIRIRHDPEMQDPDKSFRLHNTARCTMIRWCQKFEAKS